MGKPAIDLNAIEEYGFNLQRSLGDIMFADKRLDSLQIIIMVAECLLGDNTFDADLRSQLRLLNQRRHLLVHRLGVVDKYYLSKTNDNTDIGSKLLISGHDVTRQVKTVQEAIIVLIKAAEVKHEFGDSPKAKSPANPPNP